MPFKRFLSLFLALLMLTSTAFAWGEKTNEDAYKQAIDLLQANKYTEAAQAFFTLGNYSDAPQLAMYCSAVASGESGLYSVAVTNFQSLGAFRDAPLLALYYAGRAYEAAEEYESAQEIYAGMTLYRDVATRLATYPEKILARDYAKADAAEQANLLETALAGFQALGSYKDSEARVTTVQEKINARDYAAADAAETNGDLDTALKGFTALGSYRDSAERALAIQNKIDENARAAAYAAADEAEKNEDFATAYNGFLALGDYLDSAERALAVQDKGTYAQAMRYIMAGKYAQAYPLFVDLAKKGYADSVEKAYVLGVTNFANIDDKGNGIAAFQFHDVWGLINTNTNITVSPYWDSIDQFNEHGLARVTKNDLQGYINTQGEIVISCSWYAVSDFANGLCTVARQVYNSSNYLFGLLDAQGNVVTDAGWRTLGNSNNSDWDNSWYNYAWISAPSVSDGKIKVQDKNGLWGFIDQTGARVGQVAWADIKDFSEGLAAVCKNKKYGYIDKDGNVVIEPTYGDAHSFHEGLAAVRVGDKWQYINPSNEVIIKPRYAQAGNFVDGQADVFLPGTGWQIIDKKGSLLYFISGETMANYQTAVEYMNAGQYEKAIELFVALDNYQDSASLLTEAKYLHAKVLLEEGNYADAYATFSSIKDYKDAGDLVNETIYLHAKALMEAGDYDKARAMFSSIKDYKDVDTQLKDIDVLQNEPKYLQAKALLEAGDYDGALAEFSSIKDYKDAGDLVNETSYLQAKSLMEAGDYEKARAIFTSIKDYKDVDTQLKDIDVLQNEPKYLQAKALLEEGDYNNAYAVFISIKGYKDVDNLLATNHNLLTAALDAAFQPGKYVSFGHYPQTTAGNDNTSIEWLVLARDGKKALLLSRYGLDTKAYNAQLTSITWEQCTLRKWLNNDFLNKAFSSQEQDAIVLTNVDNSKNQGYIDWPARGGNNTHDKVFLLSYAETQKYLGVNYWEVDKKNNYPNKTSRVEPTAYAIKQGAFASSDDKTADGKAAGWWWLRSPGYYQSCAAHVGSGGSLSYSGVIRDDISVRPALWVNL